MMKEDQSPDFPMIQSTMVLDSLCPVREAEENPPDEPEAKRVRKKGPVEDPSSRKARIGRV